MRTLLGITSMLLLVFAFAMASSSPANSQMSTTFPFNAEQMTIRGCLTAANGGYTLTDAQGNLWTLEGNADQLKSNVGHTVAITGKGGDAAALLGNSNRYVDVDMTAITDFQVSGVQQISATCSAQTERDAQIKASDMRAAG